jgi:hypothetical protein
MTMHRLALLVCLVLATAILHAAAEPTEHPIDSQEAFKAFAPFGFFAVTRGAADASWPFVVQMPNKSGFGRLRGMQMVYRDDAGMPVLEVYSVVAPENDLLTSFSGRLRREHFDRSSIVAFYWPEGVDRDAEGGERFVTKVHVAMGAAMVRTAQQGAQDE